MIHKKTISFVSLILIILNMGWALGIKADDMPVYKIEFNDGQITPLFLEVAANQPFKIELFNIGKSPIEFESLELRKEKVLSPGTQSFIVIRRLAPGEYKFFDDFHLDAPHAVIRAILK